MRRPQIMPDPRPRGAPSTQTPVREIQNVAQNVSSSTNVSSPGSPGPDVRSAETAQSQSSHHSGPSASGTQTVASWSGGPRGEDFPLPPQAAVPQDPLDHLALRRLDERDHLHRPAALRTRQRIDLVHPLDEHRPGLVAAAPRRRRLHHGGASRSAALRRMPRDLFEYQP